MAIVNQVGNMVLVNAQTENVFGYSREELFGNPVEMLLPMRLRGGHAAFRTNYLVSPQVRPMGSGLALLGRRKDGSEFPVEVSLAPMRSVEGLLISSTIRDVTERKQSEEDRERLISDLQCALSQVKVLSGLLPICASCKKIRDEQGDWTSVEAYIKDRSNADFTHGICPQCAHRLYPEVYKK